ncbi:MAG: 16S rRNA (uracil(1498)-N(3))-methyltransferase [Clostridia bacterium]|nr:16S rRNA (uracil(1498)-N(3))-methyltransferase [Clostridia bacterium]
MEKRMPRFFVSDAPAPDGRLSLRGADAFHIARSLRMAVGDPLTVCLPDGTVCLCRLLSIRDDEAVCRVDETRPADSEPPVPVTLCFAWSKGDKPEIITQKAVELGASRLVPFFSERCVARPPEDRLPRRVERLRRVAEEAAGQCGRSLLPRVDAPCSFERMLAAATEEGLCLFCYEGERALSIKAALEQAPTPARVTLIVGAEGGFSEKEADLARESGAVIVHLGPRILRCETAPEAALAAISCRFEL